MDPVTAGVVPNVVDLFFMNLATNKFFNAFIMIMMNIGGKYLALELPQNIDKLFQTHQFLRYLVIFAICFMATRDIKYAMFMALVVIIIFRYVLNESSMYCMVKEEYFENLKKGDEKKPTLPTMPQTQPQTTDPHKKISKNEFESARDLVDRYLEQNNHEFSPHRHFMKD